MTNGIDLARETYAALAKARSLREMRAAFDAQGDRFAPPSETRCTSTIVGGRPAEWWEADGTSERVIYFLHGGGYILGSLKGYRHLAAKLAQSSGSRVLLLDYRLAPEHVYPAALDDALAGYRDVLAQGVDANRIAFVGDSAGGNLVMTALLALREAGEPLPACAACLSPWVDYDANGATMETKAAVEPAMTREALHLARKLYFAGADPNSIKAVNLLRADLSGLPPLLIQVGSHEVLLDDSLRLAALAAQYDVTCTLEVWAKMIHVFQLYYPLLAQGCSAIERLSAFTREHCAA